MKSWSVTYAPPVVLIASLIIILVWAAGLIAGPVAVRLFVGSWAALFLWATSTAFWVLIKTRRQRRELAEAIERAARKPPPYLLGTADGPIRPGDLVRFDTTTNKVKRVEGLPLTPEAPVQ